LAVDDEPGPVFADRSGAAVSVNAPSPLANVIVNAEALPPPRGEEGKKVARAVLEGSPDRL
jgi:hypothetical protein